MCLTLFCTFHPPQVLGSALHSECHKNTPTLHLTKRSSSHSLWGTLWTWRRDGCCRHTPTRGTNLLPRRPQRGGVAVPPTLIPWGSPAGGQRATRRHPEPRGKFCPSSTGLQAQSLSHKHFLNCSDPVNCYYQIHQVQELEEGIQPQGVALGAEGTMMCGDPTGSSFSLMLLSSRTPSFLPAHTYAYGGDQCNTTGRGLLRGCGGYKS